MDERSLRILAVGDLMLGDSPTCVGFGFRSCHDARGLADALKGLQPLLSGADLVFGNLETPLSDDGLVPGDWKTSQLRGDASFAPVLRAAGFTVVSVANNHASQHGVRAFEDSIRTLRAAGIVPCGLRGTAPWSSDPVSLVVGGARIGILAYCLRPRQFGNQEPPFAEGDAEHICGDVRRLRATVDAVVVSLHWGEEFVGEPSEEEVRNAHACVDAGASLIIGHHPHVTRPVERYRNAVIAYSLGNCVSDMVWYEPLRYGSVLSVELTGDRATAASVTPTRVDRAFGVAPIGQPQPTVASQDLVSLPAPAYARAVASSVRRQRRALYRYVLLRVWRFRPAVLLELARRTAGNKLALFSR